MKQIMKKLFPHTLWNRDTTSLLGCAASKFIVFDIIWCLQTTFTSFSLPEVYVNSLLAALLFILPFMLTGKKWLEYIVLFILDGLLISNLMYCRTYNSMIPLESYLLASNLSDFTASVIDSMRWIDALLPLSTLICIYSLHKRKNRRAEASGRERGAYALRIKQYALTTLAAFLLSVILIFAKGGPEKAFNNLDNANMYTCKVPMYTIFGNLIHEANQQKTVFTPKIKAEIDNWMKHQPAYQPLADSIARKKTLVVIFCESLESWEINRKEKVRKSLQT
jgi:lipoteichoic acid synthase